MMTDNVLNDSKLVLLYKNGDDEAFRQLVKRHRDRIYSAILLIVKDSNLAEDLLQEVLVKAVKTIRSGKYNEEGKFLPWIMRIANNLAIDSFRKSKRYPYVMIDEYNTTFESLSYSEAPYESQQIQKEMHLKLKQLIQELPKSQREVLIMRNYMDMSFKEIADSTGVSINTALGRMRYALINLRKKFDDINLTYDYYNVA